MANYIDAELIQKLKIACIARYPYSYIDGIFAFAREIAEMPTADVVSIETVKAWLLKMAKMNNSVVLDGNFSSACEELASNIDELRKFAEGGVIDGKHKQNT